MPSTDRQRHVTHIRRQETINGRPYIVEVQLVGVNQGRAQRARREATTALMPFYGATPDAAAERLTRWLSRAGKATETEPTAVAEDSVS